MKWLVGGAVISAVVGLPAAFYVAHQVARNDEAATAFHQWIELRSRAASALALVTRHERRTQGRRRSPEAYTLGMSGGSQIPGEEELYSVLDYYEFWGSQISRGRVDPAELSSYLGDEPRDWLNALVGLLNRSRDQPSLDGDRYEQLTHAITTLRILANGETERVSALGWRPVCMSNERLIDDDDARSTTFEATLHNRNLANSPVAGLCIECRDLDGARVGHWLIYPSDAAIPGLGTIEIRGRLAWPERGRPATIRCVESIEDHYDADGLRGRFPGPGNSTRIES